MDRPLTLRWFFALLPVTGVAAGWTGYEWGRYDGTVQQLHDLQGPSR